MKVYKYSMRSLLFGNGRSVKENKQRDLKLERKYDQLPGVAEIRRSGRVKVKSNKNA